MEATESLETIQARHRKEQRDLQSRITSKKKNATKKTRKGVNDECAQLEQQLKERQQQELAALNGESNDVADDAEAEEQNENEPRQPDLDGETTSGANGIAEQLQQTTISEPAEEPQQPGKKRNRQKERLARRAAEQEAAALAAEEEAANMTDHRQIEKTYMLKEFKTHDLAEKEIQPDGHCLFSAVADQLREYSIPLDGGPGGEGDKAKGELPYRTVRKRATDYMRAHEDDFAPFMEDDFGRYVARIRDTAEWGGQLELMALARSYGVEIKVVQEQRTETIDPGELSGAGEGARKTIWLAYYRHGYGLGEHYNSLRKAT
ncbi:OTU domain-containing protein 2 [Apiospora rasikravindrae]|uniref:OTU domain-containing protein 2 n=1 Tax=Apiospora rasikravindrae TaxID=990691 RepID=A0ABR1TCH8_9PEZI